MSATERMIAFHLARLKDKNPEVRIKSIEELALLQATDAYPTLEDLFRNDPDLDVRKAAQKAGKVLFLIMHNNNHRPPEA
jgi:hypothetical protein